MTNVICPNGYNIMGQLNHSKNIRATSLEEFWGEDFRDSLYLWEGAKHSLTLEEMEKTEAETADDIFGTAKSTMEANKYCRRVYHDILPKLGSKLNEILKVNMTERFWRTAFGYWFFRHICITYEKYTYLSKLDINRISVKLLDRKNFYIPESHSDYVYCFCNDFGVQQLVSLYFYLFKSRDYPEIPMNYEIEEGCDRKDVYLSGSFISWDICKKALPSGVKALKETARKIKKTFIHIDPVIALCGVGYTNRVRRSLFLRSRGKIGSLEIPEIGIDCPVNIERREELLGIDTKNDFEYFLVNTLTCCFPKMFIEKFQWYYDAFSKDIDRRKFTHIVSERWLSDIGISIYIAVAQSKGRISICQEHGSGAIFDETSLSWMGRLCFDKFLTVGWKGNEDKTEEGGFGCRDIKPYKFHKKKEDILYVGRTKFPYMLEFSIYNAPNAQIIRDLKRVRDFYYLLPEHLRNNFVFRPRRARHLLDIERILEIKRKNIRVAEGNFPECIQKSGIIIIDHLSTGISEILLMRAPFLIIQDKKRMFPYSNDLIEVFYSLKSCGVLHYNVQSAICHLSLIRDDVRKWWESSSVQGAIGELVLRTLGRPSKTIDYFLSCLKKDEAI